MAADSFLRGSLITRGGSNSFVGRKLNEPEGRVRWITRGQADALVEAARSNPRPPYLADFISLAFHTGCRSGE